ncbi:CBL-interacting serine/threonine-protein kinase 1 [Ectocarpus siliculosus]|uniref:CBL-interacting serine/threonine-protein kinase 1 n=1 Tax=Ectocarpus siliculosus TaxID=2880 RepID=D7FM76_ECTSI|nr:CBL-interacting serine/threonine-protein kinase 1 [Ectocarpus siliculosus]|eukprot:CBJ29899.1 CBL-interacting serine/threonine-protein kinase 1 [Ectocarpus siliculosus]
MWPNPDDSATFVTPFREEDRTHVAVKMSSLEKMATVSQENAFKEISVMRHLMQAGEHPHVMPVISACMSTTHLFVVTPFYMGGDLLSRVELHGTGEGNARRWFRQILLGLAYIHQQGLCHHDVSPENVVITNNGEAAVVMDFGMVQRLQTGPNGQSRMCPQECSIDSISADRARMCFIGDGICRYMAPEIWENREYDGRSADIWSVAVSLLVCLVGEEQWKAPTRVPLGDRGIYTYVLVTSLLMIQVAIGTRRRRFC